MEREKGRKKGWAIQRRCGILTYEGLCFVGVMLPRKPLDRFRLQGPLCAVLGHEDGSDAASAARA